MYNLDGKVALVTGAGGEHGIGRAIAVRLAKEGADVIVNDVVSNPYSDWGTAWEGVPSVVREIEDLGRRSIGVIADVSKSSQVDDMVSRAVEEFGRVDILVTSAGTRPGPDRVPVVDLEEETWDAVHNVDLKGTFLCCRAVARHMLAREPGGKIITMASAAGKRGRARFAAYCAAKFGVVGFTQALAMELASHHVNVNAICPAIVDTERWSYLGAALSGEDITGVEFQRTGRHAENMKKSGSEVPWKRVASVNDVAQTAAFLASAESDYLTGLSISVAGGAEMA